MSTSPRGVTQSPYHFSSRNTDADPTWRRPVEWSEILEVVEADPLLRARAAPMSGHAMERRAAPRSVHAGPEVLAHGADRPHFGGEAFQALGAGGRLLSGVYVGANLDARRILRHGRVDVAVRGRDL